MRVINVSVFCLRTLHPCVRACENVVTDFQLAEILSGTFCSGKTGVCTMKGKGKSVPLHSVKAYRGRKAVDPIFL